MITVIQGVDFSNVSIGTVQVPIDWDSDALAYKSAIPITSANFTYAKEKALNNFFKGLKTAQIWGKINRLYLPLFGAIEGSVNLKTPGLNGLGLPASGPIATYDANGVLFSGIFSAGVITQAQLGDSHYGIYDTTNSEEVSARVAIGLGPATGVVYSISRRNTSTSNLSLFAVDSTNRASIANHANSKGVLIGSMNKSIERMSVQSLGEYASYTAPSAGSIPINAMSRNIILGSSSANAYSFPLNGRIGLVTIGTYLNQSELALYSALQTDLITALMA